MKFNVNIIVKTSVFLYNIFRRHISIIYRKECAVPMKNVRRTAKISALLIPILVILIYLDDAVLYRYFDFDVIYYYGLLICFVISMSSWVTLAVRSARNRSFIRKGNDSSNNPHPYTAHIIFGIINFFILLCALVYGFYDMATDTGAFAGLGGSILVYFVSPVFFILLILNVILYVRKHEKNGAIIISTKVKAIGSTISALLALCFHIWISDIISLCCIVIFTSLAIFLWIITLTIHTDK